MSVKTAPMRARRHPESGNGATRMRAKADARIVGLSTPGERASARRTRHPRPRHLGWLCALALGVTAAHAAHDAGAVRVRVTHEGAAVAGAQVTAGGQAAVTGPSGDATLTLPLGPARIEIASEGLEPATAEVTVRADVAVDVEVELHEPLEVEEEIVVTATRTGRRLQDEPVRVEVLAREEIEEKLLMTPGDVAMLLNETSGLRVQVAAPSLGAANVRIQGLRGRYTQILADGLPLYGGQTGSIGLLQIPPMDLGQVEIVKGVASAFYGASALGGVVNLVSRRPAAEAPRRELLLNRTTRAGTDGILWWTARPSERVGLTVLGGGHHQARQDVDGDGWADLAGYGRVLARPRLFWEDGRGRSLFVTAGAMGEDRRGGTLAGRVVPDGQPFEESLDTRRYDGGAAVRIPLGARVLSLRGSAMRQAHDHDFGDVRERDRHQTAMAEASLMGASGRHTWVVGAAVQSDRYRARDVAGFDYTHTAPGLFVQDDFAPNAEVTLSASARLDHHSVYGTFLNPRASALWRPGPWTVRASAGSGFFAPTPFTEAIEAVGLSRLSPLAGVRAERAASASLDAGRVVGPLELHLTGFASHIREPVAERRQDGLALVNAPGPTRSGGLEALARLRWRDYVATATYTFTRSTEADADTGRRQEVALTPRHALGLVAAWERHGRARVGLEVYYTGGQRLDENPYRATGPSYLVLGLLAERRFGRVRVFVNGENLADTRQTRYDPLVRPTRADDGRWTVDAWAPLEGRTVNGGVRIGF